MAPRRGSHRLLVESENPECRQAGATRGRHPDTKENRAWFEEWARETLLPRFRQDTIYLRFYGSGHRMAVVTVVRPEKPGR